MSNLPPPHGGIASSSPTCTLLNAHSRPRGAPNDDAVRAALDALYEADGRLPVLALAKRLNAEPPHARRAVDGLQRLLNVDGYSVLPLSIDGEHIELDPILLVERFGLNS